VGNFRGWWYRYWNWILYFPKSRDLCDIKAGISE